MLKNKQLMSVTIRTYMRQQQQLVSVRNRTLAQQMEDRPSVQVALKCKQSLKQHLGRSDIQAVRPTCRGPGGGAIGG